MFIELGSGPNLIIINAAHFLYAISRDEGTIIYLAGGQYVAVELPCQDIMLAIELAQAGA